MPLMGYGDGTLRQRPPNGAHAGRWEYRRSVDGRRRTATWDRKPTRAQITAKIAEWSSTSPPPSAGDTLAEYLDRWLRDGTTHLRGRTIRGYKTLAEGSIRPALGSLPLVQLTTPQVQRWINDGATQHALAVLRAALSEAVRWGLIPSNPARAVRLPKREKREQPILSPEQTRSLIAAVKDDPMEALFVLAIFTGMRQGEILGLRWRDVDLDKATLTVSTSLWWMPAEPRHPKPVLTKPKTERSRRTIALAPLVVEKLTEHRKRQLRDAPSKDGLVFTKPDGTAMHPTAVYDALQRHEKAAGLPVTTFHAIRHGAASFLIAAGVPVPQVSELLGHSTVATTLSIYAHAVEKSRHTADTMARLMGVAEVG